MFIKGVIMTLPALLILVLIIGFPIGWLISEFRSGRPLRITLGILTISCSFGVAAIVGMFSELNYNAWYGNATHKLINTMVVEIRDGNEDRVMKVLRGLNNQYSPSYEKNPDYYLSFVEEATARMRGNIEIEEGSEWDTADIDRSSWIGYWEEDSGFWLIINTSKSPFGIFRSGDPTTRMESVIVSDDYKVLTFQEAGGMRHTLTLINKNEAEHEWFDPEENAVWRTVRIRRLTRFNKG